MWEPTEMWLKEAIRMWVLSTIPVGEGEGEQGHLWKNE